MLTQASMTVVGHRAVAMARAVDQWDPVDVTAPGLSVAIDPAIQS
jgi:hypothetical protein